jgi:hypothetical protein
MLQRVDQIAEQDSFDRVLREGRRQLGGIGEEGRAQRLCGSYSNLPIAQVSEGLLWPPSIQFLAETYRACVENTSAELIADHAL